MELLALTLPYVQIALSVILIILILLQQTGAGIGAFGGDTQGVGYHTRRGAEKVLFNATIVVAVVFALAAFVALIV